MSSDTRGIVAAPYKCRMFDLRRAILNALREVPSDNPFTKTAASFAAIEMGDGYLIVDFKDGSDRRRMFVFVDYADTTCELVRLAGSHGLLFSMGDYGRSHELIRLMLNQFPENDRWFQASDLDSYDKIEHIPATNAHKEATCQPGKP